MATPSSNRTPRRSKADMPCRWKCGGSAAGRVSGICQRCCDKRDARNKRIDAGLESYVAPSQRPGHRLYEGRPKRTLSAAHKAALAAARGRRNGND